MLLQAMPLTPDAIDAPSAEACEDAALVRRAAAADIAAFEQLYRRHHARMHGVIARLVGQAGAAVHKRLGDHLG